MDLCYTVWLIVKSALPNSNGQNGFKTTVFGTKVGSIVLGWFTQKSNICLKWD